MSVSVNIADDVRAAARRTPDRPALIEGNSSITWLELDASVDSVASGLLARGLHPGDRVALLMGNSGTYVITYYALLRAGFVAVPMNPAYTAAEVAILLSDSGARLLLVEPATAVVGNEVVDAIVGCEILDISTSDWEGVLATDARAIDSWPVTSSDALALLLFTAGTSGRPKGAMLSHGALHANIEMLRTLHDPAPILDSDTVLIVLPLFHVYGLNTALGLSVSAGATCVLVDRFDPVESLHLIADQQVTTVAGAPAMYQAWCAQPGLGDAMRSVRLFSSGGSPLPVGVFENFASLTGKEIFEGYGMTETSPVVSTTLVSGVARAGSVGRALPGLEVRLVDDEGHVVDEGDPGEVCVRGASVFTGYWPSGEGGPDQDGWFRSGDVAYVDAEGDLHLVDRRREVILVNGFNVYPREIELVIESLDGVAEVAVMGVHDDLSGEAVTALVVPAAGAPLTPDEVSAHCATRLARFKCPSSVRLVVALPHSTTGKVARGRLREVYGEQ